MRKINLSLTVFFLLCPVILAPTKARASGPAEQLEPIRTGTLTAHIIQFTGTSVKQSETSATCKMDSDKVPVFETRKSQNNFYLTPYLIFCKFMSSKQLPIKVWVGAVAALERPTGTAQAEQKSFMMNAAIEDPASGRELSFTSNSVGIENLSTKAVNLEARASLPTEYGGDRFLIQVRIEDGFSD